MPNHIGFLGTPWTPAPNQSLAPTEQFEPEMTLAELEQRLGQAAIPPSGPATRFGPAPVFGQPPRLVPPTAAASRMLGPELADVLAQQPTSAKLMFGSPPPAATQMRTGVTTVGPPMAPPTVLPQAAPIERLPGRIARKPGGYEEDYPAMVVDLFSAGKITGAQAGAALDAFGAQRGSPRDLQSRLLQSATKVEEIRAGAAAREFEEESAAQKQKANELQIAQATNAALAKETAQKQQDYDAAYNNQLDIQKHAAEDAKGTIDPDRYWKNKGTGGKIMAIVGAMLGAMGSAMLRQPDRSMEWISAAIDRDIDSQKADLQSKRAYSAEQGGILAQIHRRLPDLMQATAASKAMIWENLANRTDQLIAGTRSQIAKDRGAALRAEMEERRKAALLQQQLLAEAAAQQIATAQAVARPEGGIQWGEATEEQSRLYVEGAGGLARTPKAADDLREQLAATGNVVGNIDLILSLTSPTSKIDYLDAKPRVEAATQDLHLQLLRAAKAGAYDKGSAAAMERIITPTSDFWAPAAAAKLLDAKNRTLQSQENNIRSASITPAVSEMRVSESGKSRGKTTRYIGLIPVSRERMEWQLRKALEASGRVPIQELKEFTPGIE